MSVKLLTEFLSLKGGCTGPHESTLVRISNCWKSHAVPILFQYSECGNLLSPTDGSYYLSNGNLVESIATFTCDIGNEMTGLSQIVCLSSGDWSESAPTCSLVGELKCFT